MRERRVFRDRVDAALEGHGTLLLLGGQAGIGKTALARDFAASAQRRGLTALSGHCFDLTATPPYGPWLDLGARYRPGNNLPPLPGGLRAEEIEHIASRSVLFAQVQAFFTDLATACPAVIVLEDFHWADTASIELLRHLARDLTTLPLIVVVTYRVDDPGQDQPFTKHLPSLIRETEGDRLELRPLNRVELKHLVADYCQLSKDDEDRLVAYLDRRAEGNPFYIAELLRMLREQGMLRLTQMEWLLGDLKGAPVPPLLRQIIDDRVERLGQAMSEPLAVAAVIGQEVPLDLWGTVAEIGEEGLLEIVERSIDAHLIEAAADENRVRFVHALTREALYEGIVPQRRRMWHRRVAETLISSREVSLDAVASHLQLAGDPRAPQWLVRAGERAQRAYAWSTAVERLAAAASVLEDVPGQEALRASLLYRCGRLQRYSRLNQGIADLAAAEALAIDIGNRHLEAEARYSRGLVRCYADDFRLGLTEMMAGIESLEALPVDHSRSEAATWFADALPTRIPAGDEDGAAADAFLHTRGVHHRRGGLPWFLATAGRLAEAEALGEAFVSLVDETPAPGVLLLADIGHAHHGLAIAHAAKGRVQSAREAFARAREIYERLDHHAAIAYTLLAEQRDVVLPYLTTELAERTRMAAAAEDALKRAGGALLDAVSPLRAHLARLFLEGRWDEAREAVGDTQLHGTYCLRREVTGVFAPIAVAQGEPDQGWSYVLALLPDGPATAPGGAVLLDALLLQRIAAALCQEDGRLSEAKAWLSAHDRWLAWSGTVLGRADGLAAWSRFWLAAGEPARALAYATEAVHATERPPQPLARLVALRALGESAAAGGDSKAAQDHLLASLKLADACAAPYERALTLISLCEILAVEGQPPDLLDLVDQAETICKPLNARPALERIDALRATLEPAESTQSHMAPRGDQFGLTPRESEVLLHLATGQTNIDIADALFLSPGTVRNHVSAVLGKLGARTRTEAAAIARESGLL